MENVAMKSDIPSLDGYATKTELFSGSYNDLKDKPEAVICTCGSKPVAVYEYCNLHGLWKTEL